MKRIQQADNDTSRTTVQSSRTELAVFRNHFGRKCDGKSTDHFHREQWRRMSYTEAGLWNWICRQSKFSNENKSLHKFWTHRPARMGSSYDAAWENTLMLIQSAPQEFETKHWVRPWEFRSLVGRGALLPESCRPNKSESFLGCSGERRHETHPIEEIWRHLLGFWQHRLPTSPLPSKFCIIPGGSGPYRKRHYGGS